MTRLSFSAESCLVIEVRFVCVGLGVICLGTLAFSKTVAFEVH